MYICMYVRIYIFKERKICFGIINTCFQRDQLNCVLLLKYSQKYELNEWLYSISASSYRSSLMQYLAVFSTYKLNLIFQFIDIYGICNSCNIRSYPNTNKLKQNLEYYICRRIAVEFSPTNLLLVGAETKIKKTALGGGTKPFRFSLQPKSREIFSLTHFRAALSRSVLSVSVLCRERPGETLRRRNVGEKSEPRQKQKRKKEGRGARTGICLHFCSKIRSEIEKSSLPSLPPFTPVLYFQKSYSHHLPPISLSYSLSPSLSCLPLQ